MTGMCPHCGEEVEVKDSLTAYHDYPKPCRVVCPGSKQHPRNAESDARPLWNGKPNTRFAGAKVVHTYHDGAELIEVGGHRIQYGYGNGGDGFCYAHQNFDCADLLTPEEQEAVSHAEQPFDVTSIPRRPQRQDSVLNQLHDLRLVADRLGMYDASDWVQAHIEEARLLKRFDQPREAQ